MFIDPQPDFLRLVQNDEYLPSVSIWTRLGGIFLIGSVGAAFSLASVFQYNIIVKADATVRPTGEIRLVQAAAEGTVTNIKVKENQVVKKGDTIALIDNSQLQTKKSQLLGTIKQNQLQRSQIDAQLKALENQMAAESNAMGQAIASAKADLSRNKRDYQDKQITSKAEVEEIEASVELAKEELKRYQKVGEGGIAFLDIKEKEQAFKAATARLERAKAALNPSDANVAIAQERISQELTKGESTIAQLNKEKEELIRRQVEIQNQISSAQQELKQVFTELQKTVIRTSESGTILKLELRNAGQVVRVGDAIAQIAPNNAPFLIKARVLSSDISKVQVCKLAQVAKCREGEVQMRLSAYPYPDYGILKGAVRSISADAITSQGNGNIAIAPYYEVTIQPERLYLKRADKSYPIQAGMEVTAEIISKKETLLTFILRKARLLTDV
ncbi:MAG: HlyD family efflux transporter periplasmic adaptor subunit [Nostoc sp.]|uniref:HlyD family secretion protein n=1 Tax=Nostoc sp. TaxID=1180 RepID=UPI002FFB31B6